MSSTSSSASEGSGEVVYRDSTELLYAEVVVSLATAVGLIVLTVIQLLYRTTRRARRLWRGENQVRFDGVHFLNKSEGNIGRKIIESGLKEHENKEFRPPSVILPAIISNERDARADCLLMLHEIRKIFYKQYGNCANLMSMRCCLSCVEGVLPLAQTEDFLRVFESVLFGQHRVDGNADIVSNDDIKFMHAFFHNTILKEIQ
ncbi:uncharacterized protein TM35_000024820 [Trypanosoma theileri]|uniref:Uncharacterized protein n=1 Tax=Trypanosoma theileri TaxID=67003 RepID=A0A1X0P877_9TRYP|nr:uncharacterized protein TM35_000024820 [Trypanosoma theileri]ORC93156.1 hypothetical protein TM35_000024820 [Trypanosoma theileri]